MPVTTALATPAIRVLARRRGGRSTPAARNEMAIGMNTTSLNAVCQRIRSVSTAKHQTDRGGERRGDDHPDGGVAQRAQRARRLERPLVVVEADELSAGARRTGCGRPSTRSGRRTSAPEQEQRRERGTGTRAGGWPVAPVPAAAPRRASLTTSRAVAPTRRRARVRPGPRRPRCGPRGPRFGSPAQPVTGCRTPARPRSPVAGRCRRRRSGC